MSLSDTETIEQMDGCLMSVYAVQRVHDFTYKRVVEAYAGMVI